ncbi:hypothetical protein G4228_014883 [Cervus hanglu yarkandensis]|nr:hypothetical protein G4228_014883 [Cervus hanglu yarkandensis]
MFLLAITCAFVSKTLSGSYMNTMLTQIERQFNIPTSLVGFINGSFEIECVKEVKSLMWVYVLVGNIIRGIGETPIMPLGISYIEDFAKSENSPLYIGLIETGAIIGPLIGLSLASFCANVYVDTESVNTDDLTITPTDTRWVGAWWIGFLICAGVNVLTAIPFFFLPKTLPKEGLEDNAETIKNDKEKQGDVKKERDGITKGKYKHFNLLFNPIYMLFILISVLQFNAFVCMISFMPKYMEQHYGKSTSEAIFLMAGIPAPIYFGALVDSTCLHWGTLKCGESGACRIYDSTSFRYIYLGLPAALRGSSYIPAFLILFILRKYRLPEENASSETMLVAKFPGKENEGKEMDQNAKVLNDGELKTKL